jgi:hypothetical protein
MDHNKDQFVINSFFPQLFPGNIPVLPLEFFHYFQKERQQLKSSKLIMKIDKAKE